MTEREKLASEFTFEELDRELLIREGKGVRVRQS
jgi:hypothetical protein